MSYIDYVIKMGQSNTRQLIKGELKFDTNLRPKGEIKYTLTGKDGNLTEANMNVIAPVSPQGFPLYNIYISPLSSPFQISMFGNAFNDEYYMTTVKDYYNNGILFYEGDGSYLNYKYIFTVYGYKVYDGNRLVKNVEYTGDKKGENCEDTQLFEVWNNGSGNIYTFKWEGGDFIFDVDGLSAFIFTIKKMQAIIKDEPCKIDFMAQFWTFYFMLNAFESVTCQTSLFCPIEPNNNYTEYYSMIGTQLSYPYVVYAQMILLNCWFLYPLKWVPTLRFAISYASQWIKELWTIDGKFDYSYLDATRLCLYKQSIAYNSALNNSI